MLLCLAGIPESPRYFYTNHKFDKTREVLKRVARFNRSDLTESEIDGIVFNSEEELLKFDGIQKSD